MDKDKLLAFWGKVSPYVGWTKRYKDSIVMNSDMCKTLSQSLSMVINTTSYIPPPPANPPVNIILKSPQISVVQNIQKIKVEKKETKIKGDLLPGFQEFKELIEKGGIKLEKVPKEKLHHTYNAKNKNPLIYINTELEVAK